jgi:ribosomal protein L32
MEKIPFLQFSQLPNFGILPWRFQKWPKNSIKARKWKKNSQNLKYIEHQKDSNCHEGKRPNNSKQIDKTANQNEWPDQDQWSEGYGI